ncbi:MAG: T9SS type B sorting domain-containing protein, partial [Dokdonia sp.]|nr:T9SS type B sorting domain-containing protein [Dokdonia sp.]
EVNFVSTTSLPLPDSQMVYARVINTTQSPTVRCFEVVILTLEVEAIPTPDQPTAYELCDDLASGSTTDEISIFDLRSQDIIIAPSNPNWEVTYYFSEVEAEVGDPATWLADMYPNVVPAAQTIWARVQDTNTGCFATVSVTLVVNPNPSPTTIAPVEVCDLNPNLGDTTADNSGLFDLVDIAVMIENGESDVTTIFYETEANANDEMSAITTDPYPSISGSIWGRVQNDNTGCFTLVEVELVVNPSPVISDPLPELTACDDDGDTEAVFDLTLNEAAIYGSQAPADFNLTYHETQASAEAPVGDPLDTPIATATLMNYTSATATIWVRLENTTTGCTHTGSFAITVAPTPIFAPPPGVWFACDTDDSGSDTDGITTFDLTGITDIITASNADIMVSYYVNAIDIPASPIPTPMAYQGTGADPQTIFMVIESTTAGMCSVQEVIDLRVNALPTLISDPLPNAVACDPDNDGFIDFDLAEYGILILDGQTGITLNFYELEQDAIDNNTTNAIDTALGYNNISGMTTLYVNAESVDNMPDNSLACAKVFSFDLEAHPTPILPDASIDLSITDCDLDGDGTELVDLTVNDAVILAAQDPSFTYILTYHIDDLSAADLSNTGVMDPMNHPVAVGMPPGPTTIFYRILFDDGSECITIGSFEVSVGEFPLIVEPMVPLEVCDDDDDEVALFDLTSIIDDLTLSNPLLNVDFYESQAVIDAGGFAIPVDQLDSYANVSNPQLMQIIVTSLEGCTVQTQLTLRVLPLPSPDNNAPDPIIVCDDDFDGFYTFDGSSVENLLDKAAEIDGSTAVEIEMFESLDDAQNYDPLTNLPTPINKSSYTNSIPNGQTIYARVDHDPIDVPGNTCFVIVTFDLIIHPLPVINPDITDPYVFCEQEDGDDSVGILNLDIIASEIGLLAAPQQETDFNITYHLDQSQADNNAFALTSPYVFTEVPAPNNGLWIRIENKVTGCYVIVFEEIIIEARPVATTPGPLMACEVVEPDPTQANGIPLAGVGEFDLTSQNEVINDGPLDGNTQVNYFTTAADALSNSNAITDPDIFFNTSNPQTIWAVTQNTLTTCASSPPVFFEISVKATPFTDLTQEGGDICVDPTTGDVLDPITLDATPQTIVSGASYGYLWYLNGNLFSQDPAISVTQTGDYTVTVTATYEDIVTGMITSCEYLAGASYTPISAPLFEVEVLEDSFNTNGLYTVQIIESTITGFGVADYEFAIDDGAFQSALTFTNVRPGDHIVYGRRLDGNCAATPVEVGIIDYPRFFTPNQDGFHDTWNILGLGSAPNLNAKIFIFDRYGKLLKQLSPKGPGWNGTYNGQPVPSNDYWFRVEFTEPDGENQGNQRTFTGHFALKR